MKYYLIPLAIIAMILIAVNAYLYQSKYIISLKKQVNKKPVICDTVFIVGKNPSISGSVIIGDESQYGDFDINTGKIIHCTTTICMYPYTMHSEIHRVDIESEILRNKFIIK